MDARGCGRVAVLMAVVMTTTGLMCQFPHCESMHCDPVDPENCTGTIRMGGGHCGCCEACFREVGPGEWCESKDPYEAFNYPITVSCKAGLYCEHKTSTCDPILG